MTDVSAEGFRWDNYVLESGDELVQSWSAHIEVRPSLLFVLGRGFDPRMCVAIEQVLALGGSGAREVYLVKFDEGAASPSRAHDELIAANEARLRKACSGAARIVEKDVPMWSGDGRRIGSRTAATVISDASDFAAYTDIVIDISAMPRGVYFPLIAKALHVLDTERSAGRPIPNLHVFVSEDASLDRRIHEQGIDETASYVHPFSGSLEMEATAGQPKVWIPILGESQEPQMIRIYDFVQPDEICPVLPSPSREPRRADNLVLEYRDLLFDRLRVEPGNFVYAAERNPFETYRQIRGTIGRYREALAPLGGCKTVVSALSSKLLSLGALLVAYELMHADGGVGIAHVETHGYTLEGATADPLESQGATELFGLWLTGECDAA